jgi:mitogen-activated protein kinase 1/3
MWSIDCILAEMLDGKPLLPGEDYDQQLSLIFNLLGSPNTEYYHAVKCRDARKYIRGLPFKSETIWKQILPKASDLALDSQDNPYLRGR